RVFSYVRWSSNEKLIIISNFQVDDSYELDLKIPEDVLKKWHIEDGHYILEEKLRGEATYSMVVENGLGSVEVKLLPLESLILSLEQ
ncbi:MAG: alpha amylase C-terminal domain-containing protein, partial [Bacteroidota bacterium]